MTFFKNSMLFSVPCSTDLSPALPKILATPLVRIHLKCCSFEWIAGNTSASQQQLDKGNLLHRPLGSPWPLYKNP